MNWASSRRATDTGGARAWRRLAAPLAIAALAALASSAFAATFYKWTDAQGDVHYGDQPPKGFKGAVERIDVDPGVNQASPGPAAGAEERGTPLRAPARAPDILEQRRATRARLDADLTQARERLDLAKQALAEFTGSGSGQVVQQTFSPSAPPSGTPPPANADGSSPGAPSMGGMLGMSGNRSNCHVNANKTVSCAGLVPNEEYQQKVAALEDAVKRAEAAVADAEIAYRKGVD